jgi:hypothetical protein
MGTGQGGEHSAHARCGSSQQQRRASVSSNVGCGCCIAATRVLAHSAGAWSSLLGCSPAYRPCAYRPYWQWLWQVICLVRVTRRACAPSAAFRASRSLGSAGNLSLHTVLVPLKHGVRGHTGPATPWWTLSRGAAAGRGRAEGDNRPSEGGGEKVHHTAAERPCWTSRRG